MKQGRRIESHGLIFPIRIKIECHFFPALKYGHGPAKSTCQVRSGHLWVWSYDRNQKMEGCVHLIVSIAGRIAPAFLFNYTGLEGKPRKLFSGCVSVCASMTSLASTPSTKATPKSVGCRVARLTVLRASVRNRANPPNEGALYYRTHTTVMIPSLSGITDEYI